MDGSLAGSNYPLYYGSWCFLTFSLSFYHYTVPLVWRRLRRRREYLLLTLYTILSSIFVHTSHAFSTSYPRKPTGTWWWLWRKCPRHSNIVLARHMPVFTYSLYSFYNTKWKRRAEAGKCGNLYEIDLLTLQLLSGATSVLLPITIYSSCKLQTGLMIFISFFSTRSPSDRYGLGYSNMNNYPETRQSSARRRYSRDYYRKFVYL